MRRGTLRLWKIFFLLNNHLLFFTFFLLFLLHTQTTDYSNLGNSIQIPSWNDILLFIVLENQLWDINSSHSDMLSRKKISHFGCKHDFSLDACLGSWWNLWVYFSEKKSVQSVCNCPQNMIKSLGKKEGELAGFKEQLQQANLALKSSEEALEVWLLNLRLEYFTSLLWVN